LRPSQRAGLARQSAAPTSPEDEEQASKRLEIAITIGLGLAAVLTATCIYLIDQHDDDALISFNSGVAKTTEATGSFVEAAQKRSADDALFTEFAIQAYAGDQGDKVAFGLSQYIKSGIMRDDLEEAVTWWGENQENGEPPTPFVDENPFFVEPERDKAEALTATATSDFETAKEEQQLGDTFIIANVIVAISLFLFGIAGVTRSVSMKVRTTVLAYVVFFVSLAIVVVG
jgi:hypothetical protein